METLPQQSVDRNFEPLSPEEVAGLKRFGKTYAMFLSQYGIDALTLVGQMEDDCLSRKALLDQIAEHRARKQNGNGRKGGE